MLPREINMELLTNKRPETKVFSKGKLSDFIQRTFKHFNANTLNLATQAYIELLKHQGKMFLSMAGAMSTAEIGITLAEMIRKDKVHGISCTGANLEEDVFMLVAHDEYLSLPNYRDLSKQDEQKLFKKHINRVTDVGIPEREAMSPIENLIMDLWNDSITPKFPHEYLYELLLSGKLEKYYQIDPKDSWVLAAAQKNLPIVVPGWEDSTLGNVFAASVSLGEVACSKVKGGIEYMVMLADWYEKTSAKYDIGFFQIGGGIAGDFSICVVPLLMQDMKKPDTPLWSYFCQISDGTTSYGGYSAAPPEEKITWGKIGPKTPTFVIESDASICIPLIFGMILGQ